MAKCFAGDHLRFVNGEWRDDNGNAIEISRVRHGRWIHETIEDDDWGGTYHSWSCSECKFPVGRNPTGENYCPNCGAKMDGGYGNSDIAGTRTLVNRLDIRYNKGSTCSTVE